MKQSIINKLESVMDNIDSKDYGKAISELHEAIRILHSNTEELFREEASNILREIQKQENKEEKKSERII